MKLRHFLPLAAIALPLLASARPAAPGLRALKNADGTIVNGYVYGDESFNWTVSEDGKTLLEYEGGKWIPAVRDGRQLKADAINIDRLRAEHPDYNISIDTNKKRMAALTPDGRSTFPTVGENIRGCVVLIEFADTKFSVPDPVKTFNDMVNKEGFSDYNAKGSARDYYIATSNGKFKPTFDILGPVTVSENHEYYIGKGSKLPGDGSNAYWGYAIDEALKELDKTVDFSVYDYDNDDKIDNIFFFYAGFGQADSGDKTTIWPHQSDFKRYELYLNLNPIYLDGKKFTTYACSNELQGGRLPAGASHPYLDGIGAFVHEFAHVLGLPDLYDSNYSGTETPGNWSVMANGTYNESSTRPPLFSAYEQWVCNWLDYEDLTPTSSGHYDIPSLSKASVDKETPKALRLRMFRPGSTSVFSQEYFVVETRSKDGWDSALPGEGIIIWHIDFNSSRWLNNEVNTGGTPHLHIVKTHGDSDVWPDGNDDAIYQNSLNVLPVYANRSEYSPVITSITYDSESRMSGLDFNTEIQIEDVTVLHNAEIASEVNRIIRLKWDKVEGVENYFVTVTSVQGNKTYVIDNFYERAVGDTDEALVRNISPSVWKQPMTAYVRCGTAIPGKDKSNEITFVPAELSAGVGEIEAAGSIRGGHGFIEAPESARIFNISGIETGRENLPAGVYMVALDGTTVKVVVK